MSGGMPLLPPYAFMAWTGTILFTVAINLNEGVCQEIRRM